MKKVLLSIGSLAGGGAERCVSVFAKKLSEKGINTAILVYGRTKNEYNVPSSVKIFAVVPDYNDYAALAYPERVKRARRIIKEFKPDSIISFLNRNQITSMFAAAGLRVHRIETVRISPWQNDKKPFFDRVLWKICFLTCYAAIMQTGEQMLYFPGFLRKKFVVVSNPLDDRYLCDYKKECSAKITHFVAAGRLDPQKNYPLMLRAFAKARDRFPDITLKIYGTGDGKYTEYLKSLVTELNLRTHVSLMGKSMNMDAEYRHADAFLMSSDYEGLPNALAEAMSQGLVAISTDCKTGPKDLIDTGVNGFLTPVGDTDKFADMIIRICELNHDKITLISHAAREKALKICGDKNSVDRIAEIV